MYYRYGQLYESNRDVTVGMSPKHLIWVGGLLIAIPLLLTLLSAARIWIPIGLFVLVIGLLLYGFKNYHDKRMRDRIEQESQQKEQ